MTERDSVDDRLHQHKCNTQLELPMIQERVLHDQIDYEYVQRKKKETSHADEVKQYSINQTENIRHKPVRR